MSLSTKRWGIFGLPVFNVFLYVQFSHCRNPCPFLFVCSKIVFLYFVSHSVRFLGPISHICSLISSLNNKQQILNLMISDISWVTEICFLFRPTNNTADILTTLTNEILTILTIYFDHTTEQETQCRSHTCNPSPRPGVPWRPSGRGGYLPYNFRFEILARKFKKWARKFKNQARKFKKVKKNFATTWRKRFFSTKVHFIQCLSGLHREGGGGAGDA